MVKAHKQNHLAPSHHIAKEWGWFLVIGVILLVLGIIASFILPFATTAAAIYIGIMMMVAGIMQIVHAFGVKDIGRLMYWLVAGLIYVVGGIICLLQPLFAATVITFIIGLLLVVAGVIRIIAGFRHHGHKGYGWLIAAGFISVIAGILITLGWPENSLWVLGMFVAIDLIIQGWSFIIFSLNLRNHDYPEYQYHETIRKNSKAMPLKKATKPMAKTMEKGAPKTIAKTMAKNTATAKMQVKQKGKNLGKKVMHKIDDSFDSAVKATKNTLKGASKNSNTTMRSANTKIKQAVHKVEKTVKNVTHKASATVKAKTKPK